MATAIMCVDSTTLSKCYSLSLHFVLLHSLHGKYSTGVKPLKVSVENGVKKQRNKKLLMNALISLSKQLKSQHVLIPFSLYNHNNFLGNVCQ